jgi:phospholipase C
MLAQQPTRNNSLSQIEHVVILMQENRFGGGFRVPCILVSPWTAGGWVCSKRFDHTSVLRFLEAFTGVRELNITDWRRRTFGDLTSAFRFQDPKSQAPVLPDTAGPLVLAKYGAANLPQPILPAGEQQAPSQEKGRRNRVPSGSRG